MSNECAGWKDELLARGREFKIAEARAIVDHISDHCTIDTQDRFHNTFFHEICPLLLIAEHVGDEATRIVFLGASCRFDGLLLLDGKRKQKVELTAAIDGQNDALSMELLAKRGHAPAIQKIQATGAKKNRTFGPNETECMRTEEYDHRTLLPLLENALDRKIGKAEMNEHYTEAWLGVVFDDYPPGAERKRKRFDPLCGHLLSKGPVRYAPFSRVFVVGVSRQFLFDSSETAQRASSE